MALTPYTGQWTDLEAAHLLRRTTFGPSFQQIKNATLTGLNATLTNLFTIPTFYEPVAFLPEETIVPLDSTWVYANYPTDPLLKANHEIARRDSLNGWLIERLSIQNLSIHEKMCLFWQNHFAASACADSRATFNYYRIIQNYALGNFKQLVKDLTIDPCMLMFLNGAQNTAASPNENYARELLELYTIGKGPLIAPGDYTNYTEQDVMEGARILTGWTVQGFLSDVSLPSSTFDVNLHDTGSKTLSAHFNNATISNANATEYSGYIDVIFQQAEVSRFICRKLYRWFVNHDISASVENTIINEMANTLLLNNYEVLPVLQELFSSDHFFDISMRGSIIKSPLDLSHSVLNTAGFNPYSVLALTNSAYRFYLNVGNSASLMGQNYIQPPNVAGWKAYYQAPDYYKLWINASYIKLRFDFTDLMTINGGYNVDNMFFKPDYFVLLNSLSIPSDAIAVIDDLCLVFYPKSADANTKSMLKDVLTNSLPDFEWTLQYTDYQNNPGNTTFSDPVKNRFELTLRALFLLPEFQTF